VNAYLRAVKSFAAWLERDRRTADSPLSHLSAGNAKLDPRHERRTLPVEELRLLLQAAKNSTKDFRGLLGQDRLMLYAVAMGTGFRVGELASLRPESFDLAANPPTATVEAGYAKNRQEATQPLPLDLAAALLVYLADRPAGQPVWRGSWSDDAADMLRIDLEAAGIPYRDGEGRVTDFHGLRHSFISLMAQSGIHPKLAQSLARHSTITLTMDRHAHVQLFDQAAALAALPSFMPSHRGPEEVLAATGTDCCDPERLRHSCAHIEETCEKVRTHNSPRMEDSLNDANRNVLSLKGVRNACDEMRKDERSAPCRTRRDRKYLGKAGVSCSARHRFRHSGGRGPTGSPRYLASRVVAGRPRPACSNAERRSRR
jgi:site-specific recombinase XerC